MSRAASRRSCRSSRGAAARGSRARRTRSARRRCCSATASSRSSRNISPTPPRFSRALVSAAAERPRQNEVCSSRNGPRTVARNPGTSSVRTSCSASISTPSRRRMPDAVALSAMRFSSGRTLTPRAATRVRTIAGRPSSRTTGRITTASGYRFEAHGTVPSSTRWSPRRVSVTGISPMPAAALNAGAMAEHSGTSPVRSSDATGAPTASRYSRPERWPHSENAVAVHSAARSKTTAACPRRSPPPRPRSSRPRCPSSRRVSNGVVSASSVALARSAARARTRPCSG